MKPVARTALVCETSKNTMKAETKYKESVSLYAETGLSIKEICERTGVGYSAFSSYLCKHFRELILKRHKSVVTIPKYLNGGAANKTTLYKTVFWERKWRQKRI